jgi:2,3-bisphosphoglycerate-independent phosphoglycerate mutase
MKLRLGHGEIAWCCELVTHHAGKIVDPVAGDIPTHESRELIESLNTQLGSDTRHWELGEGPHHLLVVREPTLVADGARSVRAPELLIGKPWRRHLPSGLLRESLGGLIDAAAKCLEDHPVNRVRVDLSENPANMLWLWGGSPPQAEVPFRERSGLTGAVISGAFALRGLAQALELEWVEGPRGLEEETFRELGKTVIGLLEEHDWVYVNVPIHSRDPLERLCAMERLDQLLCKPVTEALPRWGAWRLLAVIDDRIRQAAPFVAIGTGLPRQAVARLNAVHLAEHSLVFTEASGLFRWFTHAL